MALLNDPASMPEPMWAVTRALLFLGRPTRVQDVEALMSPPSLFEGTAAAEKDHTFDNAYKTLADYDIVTGTDDMLVLSPRCRRVRIDSYAGYTDLLRAAVLDPERNSGLADNADQHGPRDLTRALAWFLARDPLSAPLGWDEASAEQSNPVRPPFPGLIGAMPFVNDFRWNRFVYWSTGLGLASPSILRTEGTATRIIPDCTAAVGRVIRQLWPTGKRVAAHQAVEDITAALPVLPGGDFSRALGIPESESLSPALSFAVLSAADRGWIELGQQDDAPRDVVLLDPDAASDRRRVTELVVKEIADV